MRLPPRAARTLHRRACLPAAMALAALLLLALPSGALPTPPACTVTLDSNMKTADITAALGQTLAFSGAVNVTTGTTNPRSLNIVAEISPTEWATQVTPTSEEVADGETVRFDSTVAVPPAALSAMRGTLTIRASFLAVPGVPASLVECVQTATILVAQYYRVDIDASEPRLSVYSGPNGIEASLIVHNLGNGRDTFTLELEDPLFLDQVKLHTNLPRRITLDPDEETNMTFAVNASFDAVPGNYDLAVVLTSDAQPATARDTFQFTVIVQETIIDQIIPDLTGLLMLLGALAALVGIVTVRRRVKRNRKAREARRQLQQVLRQRREAGAAEVGAVEEGSGTDQPPPDQALLGAPGEGAAEPAEKVRVRVKAPPRA